jgi:hypothetical protein
MSIVVTALDAWNSSGPEDSSGQHVQLILAKFFEEMEVHGYQGSICRDYYMADGPQEKLLRVDIGVWRLHAQDCGIDIEMDSAIRSEPALSGLKYLPKTTRDYYTEISELVKLLIWLLNTRYSSFGVSNAAVFGVAILLGKVGMKIGTHQNPPSIDDSKKTFWIEGGGKSVVYLLGNTGNSHSDISLSD